MGPGIARADLAGGLRRFDPPGQNADCALDDLVMPDPRKLREIARFPDHHLGDGAEGQDGEQFGEAGEQRAQPIGERTVMLRERAGEGGVYVRPAIVRMPSQTPVVRHETFAPILYVMTWRDFDDAVAMQNAVPQGLSSCVFTDRVSEAEAFLSAWGSDCGIANVNIGPSGAEIGGAFGGEKETGGGRESGSDAWKAYMRRQTQTVNFSGALPLAQGVRFDL